jgi:hypothetical protein
VRTRIGIHVASVRSIRFSGGSGVAVVEVVMGATAEGVASTSTGEGDQQLKIESFIDIDPYWRRPGTRKPVA